MRVFVAWRSELVGGKGVEHEGIVGVGRMRELDFQSLLGGFGGCSRAGHGFRILFLHRCIRGAADGSERPRGGERTPDDGDSQMAPRRPRHDLETKKKVAYGARTCVVRGRG